MADALDLSLRRKTRYIHPVFVYALQKKTMWSERMSVRREMRERDWRLRGPFLDDLAAGRLPTEWDLELQEATVPDDLEQALERCERPFVLWQVKREEMEIGEPELETLSIPRHRLERSRSPDDLPRLDASRRMGQEIWRRKVIREAWGHIRQELGELLATPPEPPAID